MNHRRAAILAVAVCALVAGSGCMCNMSGIAPSTTPITANDTYTILGRASGQAWGVTLIVVPLFESDPSRKAVERAIRSGGGNALIEVSQDVNVFLFPWLQVYWTNVVGTAVQVERGGAKSTQAAPDAEAELAQAPLQLGDWARAQRK